jgi:NAD(P)-dependent dehydrogenase (short-subunit alcohol dehydrogenase family)
VSMAPSTVVLTGATSGIGRATAMRLAPRVDHLVLHGPEPAGEVEALLASLKASSWGSEIDYFSCDYGDLTSVVDLADSIGRPAARVDVLINNAGRPGAPRRITTGDGHEATLQVNYLAPVLLTSLLMRPESNIDVRRVVNIASATHFSAELPLDDLELERHRYEASGAYARSKLALVIHSCWLARATADAEIVSMHPGVIATRLLHTMFSVGGASPESAASNVVEVMGLHGDTGSYYDERSPVPPHPSAADPEIQEELQAITARLLHPFLGG